VVVDRFYSSILLAIELLGMGIYAIGAIMTNRLGYDANVKETRASRPAWHVRILPVGRRSEHRSVVVVGPQARPLPVHGLRDDGGEHRAKGQAGRGDYRAVTGRSCGLPTLDGRSGRA